MFLGKMRISVLDHVTVGVLVTVGGSLRNQVTCTA